MKTNLLSQELFEELDSLKSTHLYRELRTLTDVRGIYAKWEGRGVTLFCSNDYLGLSVDLRVIQAFQDGAREFGVGAGASRLISGTSQAAANLEERIARFKQKESALVFSTGYLANLGVVSALCGRDDLVIADKLNHASIIDACKLSGAALRIYPHKDMNYLEKILKQSERFQKKLIITDSVFSMDGDLAPLPELVELKNRYGACLMIDEAHGTGVFGKSSRGVAEHFGVEDEIDISMGTLSKAIGVLGGFVAGSKELVNYLVNKSRPFIFSTALPPAICCAAEKAIHIIESNSSLREKLWENINQMKERIEKIGSRPEIQGLSPIIPVLIGSEEKALELSKKLLNRGFFVPAVRYPAVPKGKARLRITVSALHDKTTINKFIAALNDEVSDVQHK